MLITESTTEVEILNWLAAQPSSAHAEYAFAYGTQDKRGHAAGVAAIVYWRTYSQAWAVMYVQLRGAERFGPLRGSHQFSLREDALDYVVRRVYRGARKARKALDLQAQETHQCPGCGRLMIPAKMSPAFCAWYTCANPACDD